MQFCVTRVILRDLAALVPQIFHSLHKITHFLTGYINSFICNYGRISNDAYALLSIRIVCAMTDVFRL
jgi:hypothetical protein